MQRFASASLASAFRPSVATLGYALFLAINATAVWGGVFPFLPASIQSPQTMFWFFLVEASVFAAAFLASVFGSYYLPWRAKRFLVFLAAAPYALAWAMLIAAGYLSDASFPLVVAGGAFLGIGSAGFYMLWQRLFSAAPPAEGNRDLIAGTAYASVIYLALHVIPEAVTSLLVPLVFLPLFGLAAVLASRTIDLDQPMFEDVPSEHPSVYRQALADTWRSALSLGGLGLCTGIMRAVAITGPEVGAIVNVISMAASLVAAVALLAIWSRRSVKISVLNAYRYAYFAILAAFLLLPAVPVDSVKWLAGLLYALHSVGILLMMIQCAQISRDRGMNPVFVYGFFGGTMYGLHDIGFIAGSAAQAALESGATTLSAVALASVCALGVLFAIGAKRDGDRAAVFSDGNSIELVSRGSLEVGSEGRLGVGDTDQTQKREPQAEIAGEGIEYTCDPSNGSDETASEVPHPVREVVYLDRISKQIALVKQDYGLSTREAEVAELLARGETVARVAAELFISENTVRMHSKRIYAKLDIHKKQQLRDLVGSYDPSALA